MYIKAISDSLFVLLTTFIVYHDLIFIGATFREKLVSHHRAVNKADSCLHTRRAGSKANIDWDIE